MPGKKCSEIAAELNRYASENLLQYRPSAMATGCLPLWLDWQLREDCEAVAGAGMASHGP